MKASDFYGGAESNAMISKSTNVPGGALETPPEKGGTMNRPAHFWLIMVGLLVAARLLYEFSEEA